MTVEPGVTIRDLWRQSIRSGWWPPVVPGTMAVSIGGATAINIHGKNNFARRQLRRARAVVRAAGRDRRCPALLARGERRRLSRRDRRLRHARLPRRDHPAAQARARRTAARLGHADARPRGESPAARRSRRTRPTTWSVGSICTAAAAVLGRGLLHRADQLAPGEDPDGSRWLDPAMQDVPRADVRRRAEGLDLAAACGWPCMAAAFAVVNWAKYQAGFREAQRVALPADARRLPLPARLRAALALDDEARRPDPVPAVRATP